MYIHWSLLNHSLTWALTSSESLPNSLWSSWGSSSCFWASSSVLLMASSNLALRSLKWKKKFHSNIKESTCTKETTQIFRMNWRMNRNHINVGFISYPQWFPLVVFFIMFLLNSPAPHPNCVMMNIWSMARVFLTKACVSFTFFSLSTFSFSLRLWWWCKPLQSLELSELSSGN